MNLELTQDQQVLVSSLENILSKYAEIPATFRRDYSYFSKDLHAALDANGFLDTARTPGLGPFEATLVVETVARLPLTAEAAVSALVAPMIADDILPRPLAVISGDIAKPQRYLPVAKAALMDVGDDLLLIEVDSANVETVETILAYPYGRFITPPDIGRARRLGAAAVPKFRQWMRLAVAAEVAGTMRAGVDFTVDYVKQRQMFGHSLGLFQSVQHRLAQCHQISRAIYFLVLKAGWSGDALEAILAATYAEAHIPKLVFDLHQFNGAMGITNEHKLHFWTYRLRALQAEFGGANELALEAADLLWGPAAA